MKILYYANFGNVGSDDTERHIDFALTELGHEVVKIHERKPDSVPPIGYDLFLFHKGSVEIKNVLSRIKYPKVFWYFDKVKFNNRDVILKSVISLFYYGFLTDITWDK